MVEDLARLVNPTGHIGIAGVYAEKDLRPAPQGRRHASAPGRLARTVAGSAVVTGENTEVQEHRVEIETESGPARVILEGVAAWPAGAVRPGGAGLPGAGQPGGSGHPGGGQPVEGGRPSFLLALTHGAGGDVTAPDLLAVRDAALRLGGAVALVTQPYRVRGARAPGSALRQDAAWAEIITALRDAFGRGAGAGEMLPLVQGGRSNGARVACRTAVAMGAAAVIALAFPLHPPGRPDRSRAAELRIPGTKLLIVNGDRDPFGVPGRRAGARVVVLAGETHALTRNPAAVGAAVASWLPRALGLGPAAAPNRDRPGLEMRPGMKERPSTGRI